MRLRTILSLVVFVLISAKAPAQVGDKVLRIGIGQEFDSLNPMSFSMLSASYIYGMIGRNLVSMNADMKWEAQLAQEIPSFKNKLAIIKPVNGIKKLVSIWNLKVNTKWGDGVDVTCDDVKFSWTLGNSTLVTVINRDFYTDIDSINCDPKNPKRVEMVHAKIRWDFFKLFQFYILPKHLEEVVFTKFGSEKEGYDRNSNYVKNPTLPGLSSGPFMVSEIKLGSHLMLKRNPHFFGKKPYFDRILIRLISDTSALEGNLLSKQVDMVATIGFNMDQALVLEKRFAKENLPFQVKYVTGLSYEHLDLNFDNPILTNKNVRKALVTSIDREKMTQALFEGKQPVAAHFLNPRDPLFAGLPEHLKKPQAFSKKETDKLLNNEGWKLGSDGYRYKDGKKLSLTFSTTAANRLRENVQTYIVDQWKKAGIEANVKNVVARTFFSELMNHRKFEAVGMFTWTLMPELVMTKFYSEKYIPSESNGWSGRNYAGFKSAEMDKLLEQMEIEMNNSSRQKLMNRVVEIYRNESVTVPLYNRTDISVVPVAMKGYQPSGTQQVESLYVENWSL